MNYEQIQQDAEIMTWLFLGGIGIIWMLIVALLVTIIRWIWRKSK